MLKWFGGGVDDPHLPEAQFDAILVFDTYHEMSHYEEILRHLYKALNSKGRLAIVDKQPQNTGQIRENYIIDHTIPADMVIKEVETAGFRLVQRKDEFITGYNPTSMYLLVFDK